MSQASRCWQETARDSIVDGRRQWRERLRAVGFDDGKPPRSICQASPQDCLRCVTIASAGYLPEGAYLFALLVICGRAWGAAVRLLPSVSRAELCS